MTVAAAVMVTTVVTVPTAVVMPAVVRVVVAAVVAMPRRCMVVTATPPATPVARGDRVRCRAVGLVGGFRPVVEGLGAGGNRGQQSQPEDEVDPAHVGFLPF
ncbi:hypothetical protein [Belnapia rosea]|uniref:Uncharacterized protein n=1 Tax=Belnapia rosea TaxID=938405 RepID=A0A1G6V4J6_9PROT|nr:hypothetical protein [Belnapia rosea]SDD48394.1 hypothetical protein SAMN04487779_1008123 [Belnapia rosea]